MEEFSVLRVFSNPDLCFAICLHLPFRKLHRVASVCRNFSGIVERWYEYQCMHYLDFPIVAARDWFDTSQIFRNLDLWSFHCELHYMALKGALITPVFSHLSCLQFDYSMKMMTETIFVLIREAEFCNFGLKVLAIYYERMMIILCRWPCGMPDSSRYSFVPRCSKSCNKPFGHITIPTLEPRILSPTEQTTHAVCDLMRLNDMICKLRVLYYALSFENYPRCFDDILSVQERFDDHELNRLVRYITRCVADKFSRSIYEKQDEEEEQDENMESEEDSFEETPEEFEKRKGEVERFLSVRGSFWTD